MKTTTNTLNESSTECPKFNGNKEKFQLWTAKLKTHLHNKDVKAGSRFFEKFLSKGLTFPNLKRIDLLEGEKIKEPVKELDPEAPEFLELSESEWKTALSQSRFEFQNFAEARADVMSTLSKTLPDEFLSTLSKPLNEMEPKEIWEFAKNHYSVNDGGSLVDTYAKFSSLGCRRCQSRSNMNVSQFAQMLLETKNQLNTKSDKLLGKNGAVVGSKAIAFSLLATFPSEAWANGIKFDEDFSLEKTVEQLKVVFGDKKLKTISFIKEAQLASVNAIKTSKSNDASGASDDSRRGDARRDKNVACFYCGQKGHIARKCSIKISDRKAGIYRDKVGGELKKSTNKRKAEDEKANVCATKKALTSASALRMPSDYESEEEVSKIAKYLPQTVTNSSFIVDTGSGYSLIKNRDWLKSPTKGKTVNFEFAGGQRTKSSCVGSLKLTVLGKDQIINKLQIQTVYFVPGLVTNIIGARSLTTAGYYIQQSRCGRYLGIRECSTRKLKTVANRIDGIYYVHRLTQVDRQLVCASRKLVKETYTIKETKVLFQLWHLKMGHLNKHSLIILFSKRPPGMPRLDTAKLHNLTFSCHSCHQGKMNRRSYKGAKVDTTTLPGEILHSDIKGPIKPLGIYKGEYKGRYTLTVVDKATSFKWEFILKKKNEAPAKLIALIKSLTNQKRRVITIRTDGGTEFVNATFKNFCTDYGIKFQKSNVECQEENGRAEKAHDITFKSTRCMLFGSDN